MDYSSTQPFTNRQNAYEPQFVQTLLNDEEYASFNLSLPDEKLQKMLINELDLDVNYWNQAPWNLQQTDKHNVRYLLGDQQPDNKLVMPDSKLPDNRLFASVRAILSYATGQLAVPEITPSRSDDQYLKMARAIQSALYQHSLDEHVEQKVRAAVLNLITRKRGLLKLRYDENAGLYGDIVTEVCSPDDITFDRFAGYGSNPNKIYHRLRCSVDELCAKFPSKEKEIKAAYSIIQARYSQTSKFITYFECWFTYLDEKRKPREAVCWFIPEHNLILDKMPNPNWIYTGDDMKDKQENVTFAPPKPFIWFNYLNLGKSIVDETSLFDQAKPAQDSLNQRRNQILENADYVNGRWVYSKKALKDEDAAKIVNKGPKTLAGVNAEDVGKAFMNVAPQALPNYVYNLMLDDRNEIDTIMGTPSVFRGEQPTSQDTLGRDLMVKQQAGMLQDDLVKSVQVGMEFYYKIKLQMMRVYYTDDYWFQVKGGDGKFDFIMLNGNMIDANVKIGVQVDSTLPLDKSNIRLTAMNLAKMGRIDNLTLFEDLGIPNPEIRAERLMRSQIDPLDYMASIEKGMDNSEAEVDIMLLIDNKEPQERDDYDKDYLDYFNRFLTTQRFAKLADDTKQRIVGFIMMVQHLATQTANLQTDALNEAGMMETPPPPPMPKRTENIHLAGQLDPAASLAIAGGQPLPQSANIAQLAPSPPPQQM